MAEKNPKLGARKLAEYFSIDTGKHHPQKQDHTIVESYEGNASSDRRPSLKRAHTSLLADVNNRLYNWYLMAVHKNIYPDDPKMSQSKGDCTVAKLRCCSNAPMKLSISEAIGAKVNSTEAGTHAHFVAENVLDGRAEDTNVTFFFSSYESPINLSRVDSQYFGCRH